MESSYESLNHCALETLYNRRHNDKRTCIYVSSTDISINENKNNSRSNLNHSEITDAYQQKQTASTVAAKEEEMENDDDRKQKELSDWYYIKTSSKPKSTSSYIKNLSPYVRRKVLATNNLSNSSSNIYHHHNHGSAKNLDNYVPVPAVRKFPPKSPVSYARKCYNNNMRQQKTTSSLTARIGEITSSSFEHVPSAILTRSSTSNNIRGNAFTFQSEIAPEKQFSNNSLDVKAIRIHQQQQQHNTIDEAKYREARRRPLPMIPNMPPPPSTTPPPLLLPEEHMECHREVM